MWLSPFQQMDWDQLDMNPRVIAAIKKGADLQRLTKLSSTDIQHLIKTVSGALRKNSAFTALQLFQDENLRASQRRKLSLGCPVLDDFLRGGIPLMGLTEIAGESSAGKTQIGLQLCLSVQYPYEHGGLESGAVYVCTEDVFPHKRLQQLIEGQSQLRADVPHDVVQKIRFGNGIFVEHAADIETFHECIAKKISALLARGMVRLVVIDSIAALFRCEFAAKDSVLKAKYLQTFGAKLHQLSSVFRTPVVCINQVTDMMGEGPYGDCSNPCSTGKRVVPALGITWSNQLLMRLMVSRTGRQVQAAGEVSYGSTLRTMRVIFAPHLPQSACYYTVNSEGVKGRGAETPT
ncbi:DNA repair protein XRCC3 isoform X2 [Paroedura picta]|uniref:DNA repair protein XRCC3 isoform X2 n=1 Tax=Paroedura picta TaxID=143630 RepID=UPI00405720A4